LAPGESSALNLVVSVDADAPSNLTNAVEVSTSDEVALGNNRASVTSTVTSNCQVRPPMSIAVTRVSGGRLQVNVASTTNDSVTSNALQSVTLAETTNAVVDVVGGATGLTASNTVALPTGTQRAQLLVRRQRRGPYIVRLTLTDRCGDWPTFVGEGS
jgi:hypothetical protein